MNSVDRVLTTLGREEPERVPIVELVIDPKVSKAAVPGCADVADCVDKLDMDCGSCGVLFSPVENRDDGTWVVEWGGCTSLGRRSRGSKTHRNPF